MLKINYQFRRTFQFVYCWIYISKQFPYKNKQILMVCHQQFHDWMNDFNYTFKWKCNIIKFVRLFISAILKHTRTKQFDCERIYISNLIHFEFPTKPAIGSSGMLWSMDFYKYVCYSYDKTLNFINSMHYQHCESASLI